jgi:deoxyadenosine/deoxycytidine kinase
MKEAWLEFFNKTANQEVLELERVILDSLERYARAEKEETAEIVGENVCNFLKYLWGKIFKSPEAIYFIEGNIGAGKTTFLEKIVTAPNENYWHDHRAPSNFRKCREPIALWQNTPPLPTFCLVNFFVGDIFSQFYQVMSSTLEPPARFMFTFEIYVFISRLAELARQCLRDDIDVNEIMAERSIFSDMYIFWPQVQSKMSQEERKILGDIEKCVENLLKSNEVNFKIIFVEQSPEKCLERIVTRQRKGERIKLDYLKALQTLHAELKKKISNFVVEPREFVENFISRKKIIPSCPHRRFFFENNGKERTSMRKDALRDFFEFIFKNNNNAVKELHDQVDRLIEQWEIG